MFLEGSKTRVCISMEAIFLTVLTLSVLNNLSSASLQLHYNSHPFIYFTADDIPNMREMAKTSHIHIAQRLEDAAKQIMQNRKYFMPPRDYKAFGGRWNEIYGNNLPPLALYCVLEPDDSEAFEFLLEYMDIMASLPRWQVISLPLDEVPVAHSLTGFITAFDFLYPRFSDERKTLYLQRIVNETRSFAEYSRTRSWGHFYLQNHVASNFVAFFHGCLVSYMHFPNTSPWLQFVVMMLERNFKLLNHIVDGSLDEGVAYGSYTSRSFTQYAFLALRHFGIDHTEDNWLQQHFWFFYYTVLPKFQKTVGIADSNNNWFYGPESQLVFLETYVMRNGHGNWLAEQIRRNRVTEDNHPLSSSKSQRWCTVHTEFLWYDPQIEPVPPSINAPELRNFIDWGVVTYRASPHKPNGTFIAFKSGALHGRAVFDLIERDMYPWLKGWANFNPGHEHPDQNMFILTMDGEQIVTDALYGPKLSYLNNVLAFSPSETSKCNIPWEGQLGECGKWLAYKDPKMRTYKGDVVFSDQKDNFVFISGEATKAYNAEMGLVSVFRALFLLRDDLLVIIDHIETKSRSPLKYLSAFFHNLEHEFTRTNLHETIKGVKLKISDKVYKMFWVTSLGRSPAPSIVKEVHPSEFQKRKTNFVNVTIKLTPTVTRVAYVLTGSNVSLQHVQFKDNDIEGCHLYIKTTQEYHLRLATRHDDLHSRRAYLNFPGFASVRRNLHETLFGVPYSAVKRGEIQAEQDHTFIIYSLVVLIFFCLFCLFLRPQCGRKLTIRVRTRCKLATLIVAMVTVTFISVYFSQCEHEGCVNVLREPRSKTGSIVSTETTQLDNFLPYVTVSSLPGSGFEMLGWLFYNNPDIFVLPVPHHHLLKFPKLNSIDNLFTDFCSWGRSSEEDMLRLKSWLNILPAKMFKIHESSKLDMYEDIFFGSSLQPSPPTVQKVTSKKPKLESNIIFKNYTIKMLKEHMHSYPRAIPALMFTTGSWSFKADWLFDTIGASLRHIHVIRDPRSWIANLMRDDLKLSQDLLVRKTLRHFVRTSKGGCLPNGKVVPEFEAVRATLQGIKEDEYHKLLAWVWFVHANVALRSSANLTASNFQFVKVEDMLEFAEEVTKNVYDFVGLPLRPVNIHQALQVTRSNVFMIPYEGVIGKSSITAWKQVLTSNQINDIIEICRPLMVEFGYL